MDIFAINAFWCSLSHTWSFPFLDLWAAVLSDTPMPMAASPEKPKVSGELACLYTLIDWSIDRSKSVALWLLALKKLAVEGIMTVCAPNVSFNFNQFPSCLSSGMQPSPNRWAAMKKKAQDEKAAQDFGAYPSLPYFNQLPRSNAAKEIQKGLSLLKELKCGNSYCLSADSKADLAASTAFKIFPPMCANCSHDLVGCVMSIEHLKGTLWVQVFACIIELRLVLQNLSADLTHASCIPASSAHSVQTFYESAVDATTRGRITLRCAINKPWDGYF